MKPIPKSELVLNDDGSIYHLHLHPEQIAETILIVGDQGRVQQISQHFDRIEHQVFNREFVTHTGYIGNKTLEWVQYILMGNESFCDSLLVFPEDASQYLTTLQCGESFSYDINEDGAIDNADLVALVISVINSFEIDFDINNDQITNIFDILIFSSFLEDL